MTDMAYIVSRTLEREIAIAESNDQNTLIVTLDVLKEILVLLKEQDNCENCAIAIEDRQPVIRCRDCKHWESERDGHCPYNHIFTVPDWFCADGERKDNDA